MHYPMAAAYDAVYHENSTHAAKSNWQILFVVHSKDRQGRKKNKR